MTTHGSVGGQSTGAGKGLPHRRTGRALVGHPIDVASGDQFTAAHDAEIRGAVPLIFRRVYSTRLLHRPPSVLGPGWVHQFQATLTRDLNGFEFEGHDGEQIFFDDKDDALTTTGSLLSADHSMELRREGERLVVYHWHGLDEPVQKYVFVEDNGPSMRLFSRDLPSGQGLRLSYDRAGRLEAITQTTEGRRLFLRYDEAGRLSELHLGPTVPAPAAMQLVARYRYDERGRLTAVYDALGKVQEYGYDDDNRLVLERGRSGGTYRMVYDQAGRCVESSGDEAFARRRLVFESGGITRVVDSLGNETLFQYNDLGQIERRVLSTGAVYATRFDEHGRVIAEIGPLGDTVTYAYDARGNLAKKTLPNGATQSYEYDEFHQPTKIVEPDGAIWTMRHERGALVEVIDPTGVHLKYIRNARNDIVGVTTSAGQSIRVVANDAWTEEVISDDFGLIFGRRLDLFLNATEVWDSRAKTGRFEFDPLGRAVGWSRPDGTHRSYAYDANDELVETTDGRGGRSTATYSPYGDCVAQTDPLGRQHQFRRDTEGRLLAIRNPSGQEATFVYDAVGNRVSMSDFDGSIERAEYDLAGRVARRTRPDGTVLEFERDVLGNVTKITSQGRILRTVTYDSCGAPVTATNTDSTVQIEYDLAGRVRAEIQDGRRIEYQHDSRGLLTSRHFEGSKAGPLLLEWDARGRLTSLRTPSGQGQTFAYDGNDQCVLRRLGPVVEERHFDLEGRLRHQQIGGLQARTYRYDEESALLEIADQMRGRRSFQYDLGDQLLSSVTTGEEGHRYTYDSNGNLSSRDQEVFVYEKGNRLARSNRAVYSHDPNGQLTVRRELDRETHFQWDPLGQLVRVTHGNGTETTFGYDAFGRRTFKEHAGVRTSYWWARDDLLAEESQGHVTEYALWQGELVALWEDGRIRHAVTSHQGLPQELLDEKGQVVWKGIFDDWGHLVAETGSTTCRLRLPGQIADPETGLHYNRFRYYLPEAGRFISPDPIGFEGGTNSFRYAPNAIDYIDVLGLKCGQSGCKRKPPNTADYELRDSRGRIKTRGSEVSGGTKPGRRLSFPEQQAVHTEGKILSSTAALTQPGDILTIRGREPPCGMCGPAMQQAAIDRGISIRYTDGTGTVHGYPK